MEHPYGFRIYGEQDSKLDARVERVQKPDSGHADLDPGGLAALLDDPVSEGVGNIICHALVKGHGDLTSGQPGTSMPIGDGATVSDSDDRGSVDQALAGAKAWLGT